MRSCARPLTISGLVALLREHALGYHRTCKRTIGQKRTSARARGASVSFRLSDKSPLMMSARRHAAHHEDVLLRRITVDRDAAVHHADDERAILPPLRSSRQHLPHHRRERQRRGATVIRRVGQHTLCDGHLTNGHRLHRPAIGFHGLDVLSGTLLREFARPFCQRRYDCAGWEEPAEPEQILVCP